MTPAKILLFGEYTVLVGSQALAIPFSSFSCQLVQGKDVSKTERSLSAFIEYLLSRPEEFSFLDLARLQADWQRGIALSSNIPMQYGVGSSGAVTAEIYQHYAWIKEKPLLQLKSELAAMERFMHGNSSGIDPLVCLCQQPILFSHEGSVQLIQSSLSSKVNVFLIDSQTKAPTRNYVMRFLNDYQYNKPFARQIESLIEQVNACIESYLSAEPQFTKHIKALSILQYQIFPFLFPKSILPHLQRGVEQDLFFAKLCGSGGGGFILGFSHDPQAVEQYFLSANIPILWVKDGSMCFS